MNSNATSTTTVFLSAAVDLDSSIKKKKKATYLNEHLKRYSNELKIFQTDFRYASNSTFSNA